jgi:hypothetical protein
MTAPQSIRLPIGVDQIDAAWLTDALRRSGVLAADAFVATCDARPLGAGGGLIGSLARAHVGYSGIATDAPRQLIVKFPSSVPANRAVADAFDMYGREVRFYQTLAATTSLGHPRCYFAARAADSSDFVLLLEDLGERRIGDQVAGSDGADAEVVVDAMAAFHAQSWNRVEEPRFGWLTPHANVTQVAGMQAGFAQGWPKFASDFAGVIPPTVLRWGERVGPNTGAILNALCSGPQTICHADFRLENMFFGANPSQPKFAIVDWQSITKCSGALDLAYYLTQSVQLEVRRRHERELLTRYLDGLRRGGVRDYAIGDLELDYRRAALYLLDYAVVIASTLDLGSDRGAAIARALSERACTALDDLDCQALLPN